MGRALCLCALRGTDPLLPHGRPRRSCRVRGLCWTEQVSFLEICLRYSSLLSFIESHWEGTTMGLRSSREIGKLIDPFGRTREEEEPEEVNV